MAHMKPKPGRSLGEVRPDLIDQWSDKNDLTPFDYTPSSAVKVWWKCTNGLGHAFHANIYALTRKIPIKCSVCNGKQLLANFNDLTTTHPDLAKQLDPADNNGLSGSDFSAGSSKKPVWTCDGCGHKWSATVGSRTRARPAGCPACTNRVLVVGFNDMATTHPEFAAQLLPEDNGGKGPEGFTMGYTKMLVWTCPEHGHKYTAVPGLRKKGKWGCPYCANREVLPGFNDLESQFPEVAASFHSDAEGLGRTPRSVPFGTTTKFNWECKEHGVWTAQVNSRTLYKTGCPVCGKYVSLVELRLRRLLEASNHFSTVLDSASPRVKLPWRANNYMKVDIVAGFMPEGRSIAIEYDGLRFHSDAPQVEKDIAKTRALLEAGFYVVRVRENGLPHLELEHERLLQLDYKWHHLDDTLQRDVVDKIGAWL